MHDDGLQLLLEDHGETVTVTPPDGSGAYQPQALVEEIDPQAWRHDSKATERKRQARVTLRLADCPLVPDVTPVPWTIAARGVTWKVIALTSGPVSLVLTVQHLATTHARSPRPGGL